MAEAVISIKEGLAYIIKKGNRQAVASCQLPSHQLSKQTPAASALIRTS